MRPESEKFSVFSKKLLDIVISCQCLRKSGTSGGGIAQPRKKQVI